MNTLRLAEPVERLQMTEDAPGHLAPADCRHWKPTS